MIFDLGARLAWHFNSDRPVLEQMIINDENVLKKTGEINSIRFRESIHKMDGVQFDGSIDQGFKDYRLIVKGDIRSVSVTLRKLKGKDGFQIIYISE